MTRTMGPLADAQGADVLSSSDARSLAATVAKELWSSLGVELVIFVMTLCSALIIRTVAGWRQQKGKERSADSAGTQPLSPQKAPRECGFVSPAAGTPPASGGGVSARSGAGSRQARSQSDMRRASTARSSSEPSQAIDEIVDGLREQPTVKFAARALALYGDLKASLKADDITLLEAARASRASALDLYSTLVHCAIRLTRHHLVEALVDDMVDQGVSRPLGFYESAMKQLAGQRQYRLALAVYDRLAADGLTPSAVTCSCLIGFAAEVGELQRAVSFFERLSTLTTPSIRAYMTVLRVHAKRQDWDSALATLRDMRKRGVQPDSLALNVVLATGVAADKVEAVAELIREADEQRPPIADVVSYNTLAKGYAQRGDAAGPLQAIARMRKRGLAPNSITFNTAMDAAVRSGQSGRAFALLADMRSSGLRPDKFTCSILVKGLSRSSSTAEQVDVALDLLHELDGALDATLRSTLYHSVLEAAAQNSQGGPTLAAKAFAQMRKCRVVPSTAAQRLMVQALPAAQLSAAGIEGSAQGLES